MPEPPSPQRGLDVLRTRLANERTFLAYLRTTLAFFIVTGTILHFLDPGPIRYIAYAAAAFGVITLIIGILSYRRTNRRLHAALNEAKNKHGA